VLPFGLSTACYLFTNLARLVLKKKKKKKKKWRSEGKQVIMYLDDRLGIEQDDELCKAVVNQVKCYLIDSGFVP
jgi:hypothetical protein